MYIWLHNRILHECIPRGSTLDSSDRDDRMGPKVPCQISEPKNLQKGKQVWLYCNLRTMRLRYTGTIINLLIVLNGQKNPYLNQATQNNTCQILLPKKSQNQKFQTQNNPSIIPVTWNPENPLGVHLKQGQGGTPLPHTSLLCAIELKFLRISSKTFLLELIFLTLINR